MTPAQALANSALVAWLNLPSVFATLKAVHFTALALVLTSVAVLDLAALGARWPARYSHGQRWSRWLLPMALVGLGLAVLSGLTLFVANAAVVMGSQWFALKMGLLLAAGVNAIVFAQSQSLIVKKILAILSILIWVGVVSVGVQLAAVRAQSVYAVPINS